MATVNREEVMALFASFEALMENRVETVEIARTALERRVTGIEEASTALEGRVKDVELGGATPTLWGKGVESTQPGIHPTQDANAQDLRRQS